MSDSFQPQGLQNARLPWPSLSPRVCSNSLPLMQWCYLTNSYSTALFSFCLRSFPASGSFFGGLDSKESAGQAGDSGSVPGSERSPDGMATHFSILAWRISWTEESGVLQSIRSQRTGHNWAATMFLVTFKTHPVWFGMMNPVASCFPLCGLKDCMRWTPVS